MNIQKNRQKIIGTLVPLSALKSSSDDSNNGTLATGLIFLDWLKKTHQSAWQMLPLFETQLENGSATKHIPSPYKSYCTGLDPKYLPESYIGIYPSGTEKNAFLAQEHNWLTDYALFCALRDHFHTDDWRNWGRGLKEHDRATLDQWSRQHNREIDNHIINQWQLHKAYSLLRSKAKNLNILLIGDLPYYPSLQSPLVWANQDVFQIEKDGSFQYVSGTPDSPTAHYGRQIWGHPLYNWKNTEKVIALWKIRLHYLTGLFDQIRFDHTKAIFEYGAMDLTNERNDKYIEGPGSIVFKKLIAYCREIGLTIFVEDSGERLAELRKTLRLLKIPGIKIFRFALVEKENKINTGYAHLDQFPENTVAYTTTHDTETLLGYLKLLTVEQKLRLGNSANIEYDPDNKVFAKKIRQAILRSPARTVIIPIQDWLLTTDRINIPGTELPINDPNWKFQLKIPIERLPTNLQIKT